MKEFAIYRNPVNHYEAVKKGFSWPGFFFVVIWAFIKRMWAAGCAVLGGLFLFGMMLAFMGVSDASFDMLTNIVSIILAVLFGVYGNELRETNLQERGYDLVGVVSAANPEGAIALYVKNNNV
jgi:hypothetical protein